MNHIIVEDKLRDTNPVPVVIAFTPNYFIPASTCLSSIFASLDIEAQIHVICLLSEELPDRLKQKIQPWIHQLRQLPRSHHESQNAQGEFH